MSKNKARKFVDLTEDNKSGTQKYWKKIKKTKYKKKEYISNDLI